MPKAGRSGMSRCSDVIANFAVAEALVRSETCRHAVRASAWVSNGPNTCGSLFSVLKSRQLYSPPTTQYRSVCIASPSLGSSPGRPWPDVCPLCELVHRVVHAAGLQGRFAGEVFLVVVANVRARH